MLLSFLWQQSKLDVGVILKCHCQCTMNTVHISIVSLSVCVHLSIVSLFVCVICVIFCAIFNGGAEVLAIVSLFVGLGQPGGCHFQCTFSNCVIICYARPVQDCRTRLRLLCVKFKLSALPRYQNNQIFVLFNRIPPKMESKCAANIILIFLNIGGLH